MLEVQLGIDWEVMRVRLAALADKVIPYMRTTQRQIARWALDTVRAYTPPRRSRAGFYGGGDIRDLWRMDNPLTTGEVETFIIKNIYHNQDIVLFMEEGTRPHEIRPVHSSVLHFFTYEGDEIFTKLVHHPGTPKYAMVEQTRRELEIKLDQYVQGTFAMVDRLLAEATNTAL